MLHEKIDYKNTYVAKDSRKEAGDFDGKDKSETESFIIYKWIQVTAVQ